MGKTKKQLTTSIAALGLSMAMLAGTTLAWFTDTITTSKNLIETGNLQISAKAYNADATGGTPYTLNGFKYQTVTFTSDAAIQLTNQDNNTAIFDENETNWEPGMTGAKLIEVKNDGSLAAKVNLVFKESATTQTQEEKGNLVDVLWFDILKVEDNATVGDVEKLTFAELLRKQDTVTQALSAGKSGSFILLYEDADNTYQKTDFNMDIEIRATQYAEENDAFGNTYDENAFYDVNAKVVTTAEELQAALRSDLTDNENTIVINGTIDLAKLDNNGVYTLAINKDVTILGVNNAKIMNRPTLIGQNVNATIKNITFENGHNPWNTQGNAFYATSYNGTLVLDGCTFINSQWNAIGLTGDLENANITIKNCTFKTDENVKGNVGESRYDGETLLSTKNNTNFNGKRGARYIQIQDTNSDAPQNFSVTLIDNAFYNVDRIAANPILLWGLSDDNLKNITVGGNTKDNTVSQVNREFIAVNQQNTNINLEYLQKVLDSSYVTLK
jgi:predicted ribosomally synthesized peptide with SipW-like signal peptide